MNSVKHHLNRRGVLSLISLVLLLLATAFVPTPNQAVAQTSAGDWRVVGVVSRFGPNRRQGEIRVIVISEGTQALRSIVGVRFDWVSDNQNVNGLAGEMAQTILVRNVRAGKQAWSKAFAFPNYVGDGRIPDGSIRVWLRVDPDNMDAETNEDNNLYYARCMPSWFFMPCIPLSS